MPYRVALLLLVSTSCGTTSFVPEFPILDVCLRQKMYFYHLKRTNYHCSLWRESINPQWSFPSPDGHGWDVSADGSCHVVWTDKKPAPAALLELTKCGCTRGCDTKRRSCRRNGLPCSAACQCLECSNCRRLSVNNNESGASGSDSSPETED